jgi:hypothetical protein
MNESLIVAVNPGDETVRAIGELSATAEAAAKAATDAGLDHAEVGSWITTIVKAIVDAFKYR